MLQSKIRVNDRSAAILAVVTLTLALTALPAAAAVFTVTLTNGAEIDTRYRPMQSPSDESKIQLITEHGNWITLPKSLVRSVESDFESRGFGTVLDTDTVVLGYSINDLPASAATEATSPTDRLIEFLRGPQQDPFTATQFGEPVEAGANPTGGIPVGFAGRTTPPLGTPSGTEPPIAGDNQ